VVLVGLLCGLPWALMHVIGWPLPDHIPAWAEIQDVVLGPMTTTFLLVFLACASWLVWALFTLDAARCAVEIGRAARMPDLSAAWPVRRVAAMLVGAVLISILGPRVGSAPTSPVAAGPGGDSKVMATALAWHHPAGQDAADVRLASYTAPHRAVGQVVSAKSAVALAPDPRTGVHDSLWRIAARTLGDGERWPEIFELNKGKPQPNGGAFLTPSLIFPGEEFALPAYATVPVAPSEQPDPPALPAPVTPPPSTAAPGTPATPGPSTQQAPADADSAGEPGFSWGTELFVGLSFASAVSAALVLARRRHRRRYRPGSGDRADLPVAPVVYQLRLAHLRADQDDDLDLELDDGLGQAGDRPRRAPAPAVVRGAGDGGLVEHAPVMTVGVLDGREIALDLAAAHGLGLIGPGAAAAARALLVTVLTTTTETERGATRMVVAAEDLAALLGRRAAQAPLPAGLHVVADLDAALNALEAETLVRTGRQRRQHGTGWPPLVLVARAPERQRQRLQAVLDNGSTVGVTGLLLGQWSSGATAYVRDDGTISTTSPGLGEPLRGTRVFRLGDADTADLLTLLHHADPDDELEPETATHDEHVPLVPGPDLTEPDAVRHVSDATQERGERTATEPKVESKVEALAGDTDLELRATGDAVSQRVDTNLEILGADPVPASPLGLRPRPSQPATDQAGLIGAATDADARDVDKGNPADVPEHDRTGHPLGVAVVPLRISVLGPPRVWWRPAASDSQAVEREITAVFQPRVRELLVFLALHPDGASREALIAALWASSPPEKTTNAMNTSLSRMRRAVAAATEGGLSDVVLVGEGRYQLDPELVEVDYHRFAAAVAARRAVATNQDRVEAYGRIVDSYTGPLADGLSSEWIETAREAVRRDAIDAVAALARALVDQDPQQTLDLLEVARAFDPHNELIYRDIMRLQERLGQLDAIPRTLTLLTTRLAEVDDRPTPQAVSLAQRLRRRPGDPLLADHGHSQAG